MSRELLWVIAGNLLAHSAMAGMRMATPLLVLQQGLGKLDAGTLKLKVAASIVAISSIHLLRAFMDAQDIPNDKLLWYVVIHMTFVLSAVLMGVLDRITAKAH